MGNEIEWREYRERLEGPGDDDETSAEKSARATVSALAALGLFAVTAMLVCYALEKRSSWFILGFAAACALGSVYGFLQGAWPFGLVEAIWAVVAARRWWLAARPN